MRSRLTQRIESQQKKNIVLTVIGITVIVGLLWQFGVPLIATLSYTIAGSKNEEQATQKRAYIAPPTLNDTFDATNSARVNINGSSLTDTDIELFVNNERVDSTPVESDSTFSFNGVPLNSGENTIKVRAVDNTQKSEFSNTLTITYLDEAPELSIESPSDGQQFNKDNKNVEVKGKTDPGVKVTVNDFWAIVDSDGNYTYTLLLKDGENQINVTATDDAGNKSEKQIKVNYAP